MACAARDLEVVPLFATVSAATREALAVATMVRHYRPDMFVFAEGEAAESFHFVLQGRVRVFRDTRDGHEQTLQVLHTGGLLAIVGFLDGMPYPASAQTMTAAEIGSIRNVDVARLTQSCGDLAWGLLQQLARRLLWAQGRIYDLALRSATGRVVSALLQLAREHGQMDDGGKLTVDMPLTHREIGQLIGVSRETVTRTLRQLREAGALRWTEDGLLVVDPGELRPWLEA